jgi:hypothetical protein
MQMACTLSLIYIFDRSVKLQTRSLMFMQRAVIAEEEKRTPQSYRLALKDEKGKVLGEI